MKAIPLNWSDDDVLAHINTLEARLKAAEEQRDAAVGKAALADAQLTASQAREQAALEGLEIHRRLAAAYRDELQRRWPNDNTLRALLTQPQLEAGS